MAKHIIKRPRSANTPEFNANYDQIKWVNYDFRVGEINVTAGKDRYYGFVEWVQDGDDWIMVCPECGWEMNEIEDGIRLCSNDDCDTNVDENVMEE